MTATLDPVNEALLRKMATPACLAVHASKEITGFQWTFAGHLQIMEERILDCVLDFSRQRFISISMPPRHGKSFYCSVFLAAWFLGMFPEKRVILVTYSDDFAAKWGKAVRDVLSRYGKELFGRSVSRDMSSKTDWMMERSMGGMLAVGIGGGITGQGGDLIIIDDLIKNQEEARSATTKEKHKAEFDASIRTRLEPGGSIVCVATRWAPDDLPGQLHEPNEFGDQWEFLDFAALAEPPRDVEEADFAEWEDELGRHIGEALWPERWNAEALIQIKHSVDELVWNALYQQQPRLTEGSMFGEANWLTYPAYEKLSLMQQCTRIVRSWDLAASKDKGDYTVGVLMGLHRDGRVYIFDVVRGRWTPTDVEARVRAAAEDDGPVVKIIIEQERAGAGKTVLEHYQRSLLGRYVEGNRPETDKQSRASIYSAKQGAGMVLLPDQAVWKKAWIDEHKDFGFIRHDDQVDAGAQGFNDLAGVLSNCTMWSPVGSNIGLKNMTPQLMELMNRS
jgi:predicted phage terminase large subunit-like protein